MNYHQLRPYLIFVFVGLGILLNIQVDFRSALPLYLTSLLLLFTHFAFANVWTALRQLRKGNLKAAQRLIDQVKFPRLLFRTHRSYYYFIRGFLLSQKNFKSQGASDLETALTIGMPNKRDRALINLNLAHHYYQLDNFEKVQSYLAAAKQTASNDLVLEQKVRELEAQIKVDRASQNGENQF